MKKKRYEVSRLLIDYHMNLQGVAANVGTNMASIVGRSDKDVLELVLNEAPNHVIGVKAEMERLEELAQRAISIRQQHFNDSYSYLRGENYNVAVSASNQTLAEAASTLEKAVPSDENLYKLDALHPLNDEQIENILDNSEVKGKSVLSWFKGLIDGDVKRIIKAIFIAARRGVSPKEITRIFLGSKKNGYKDGVFLKTMQQIGLFAKTIVNGISNIARKETIEDNKESIDGVRFCGVFDGRTCYYCGSNDGMVWENGDENVVTPPLHFSCRCCLIPYIHGVDKEGNPLTPPDRAEPARDFWKDAEEQYNEKPHNKDWKVLTPATRFKYYYQAQKKYEEETGQPAFKPSSGDLDFKDYFEKQSEEVKKRWLGGTRYELYKQNRLPIDALLHPQDGFHKTSDELNKQVMESASPNITDILKETKKELNRFNKIQKEWVDYVVKSDGTLTQTAISWKKFIEQGTWLTDKTKRAQLQKNIRDKYQVWKEYLKDLEKNSKYDKQRKLYEQIKVTGDANFLFFLEELKKINHEQKEQEKEDNTKPEWTGTLLTRAGTLTPKGQSYIKNIAKENVADIQKEVEEENKLWTQYLSCGLINQGITTNGAESFRRLANAIKTVLEGRDLKPFSHYLIIDGKPSHTYNTIERELQIIIKDNDYCPNAVQSYQEALNTEQNYFEQYKAAHQFEELAETNKQVESDLDRLQNLFKQVIQSFPKESSYFIDLNHEGTPACKYTDNGEDFLNDFGIENFNSVKEAGVEELREFLEHLKEEEERIEEEKEFWKDFYDSYELTFNDDVKQLLERLKNVATKFKEMASNWIASQNPVEEVNNNDEWLNGYGEFKPERKNLVRKIKQFGPGDSSLDKFELQSYRNTAGETYTEWSTLECPIGMLEDTFKQIKNRGLDNISILIQEIDRAFVQHGNDELLYWDRKSNGGGYFYNRKLQRTKEYYTLYQDNPDILKTTDQLSEAINKCDEDIQQLDNKLNNDPNNIEVKARLKDIKELKKKIKEKLNQLKFNTNQLSSKKDAKIWAQQIKKDSNFYLLSDDGAQLKPEFTNWIKEANTPARCEILLKYLIEDNLTVRGENWTNKFSVRRPKTLEKEIKDIASKINTFYPSIEKMKFKSLKINPQNPSEVLIHSNTNLTQIMQRVCSLYKMNEPIPENYFCLTEKDALNEVVNAIYECEVLDASSLAPPKSQSELLRGSAKNLGLIYSLLRRKYHKKEIVYERNLAGDLCQIQQDKPSIYRITEKYAMYNGLLYQCEKLQQNGLSESDLNNIEQSSLKALDELEKLSVSKKTKVYQLHKDLLTRVAKVRTYPRYVFKTDPIVEERFKKWTMDINSLQNDLDYQEKVKQIEENYEKELSDFIESIPKDRGEAISSTTFDKSREFHNIHRKRQQQYFQLLFPPSEPFSENAKLLYRSAPESLKCNSKTRQRINKKKTLMKQDLLSVGELYEDLSVTATIIKALGFNISELKPVKILPEALDKEGNFINSGLIEVGNMETFFEPGDLGIILSSFTGNYEDKISLSGKQYSLTYKGLLKENHLESNLSGIVHENIHSVVNSSLALQSSLKKIANQICQTNRNGNFDVRVFTPNYSEYKLNSNVEIPQESQYCLRYYESSEIEIPELFTSFFDIAIDFPWHLNNPRYSQFFNCVLQGLREGALSHKPDPEYKEEMQLKLEEEGIQNE